MFDILVASKPRTLETAHRTVMSIALHNMLLSVLLTTSVGGVGGIRNRMREIATQFGYETRYVDEELHAGAYVNEFMRDGDYSRLDDRMLRIEWQLDELGRIRSGEISPKRRPGLR